MVVLTEAGPPAAGVFEFAMADSRGPHQLSPSYPHKKNGPAETVFKLPRWAVFTDFIRL